MLTFVVQQPAYPNFHIEIIAQFLWGQSYKVGKKFMVGQPFFVMSSHWLTKVYWTHSELWIFVQHELTTSIHKSERQECFANDVLHECCLTLTSCFNFGLTAHPIRLCHIPDQQGFQNPFKLKLHLVCFSSVHLEMVWLVAKADQPYFSHYH